MGLLRWLSRIWGSSGGERPVWVKVAWAHHLPEAELLAALLRDAQIPVLIQRSPGFDVPDALAGGARHLLVPARHELEARALLDPYEPITPSDVGEDGGRAETSA